ASRRAFRGLACWRRCSACSRVSRVRRAPPSIRASSATRSVAVSGRAVDVVRPACTRFVTAMWCSAHAAISGRYVMQSTCRDRPSCPSLRPTASATAPALDGEPPGPLGRCAARALGRGLERGERFAAALRALELGRHLLAAADQVLDRAAVLPLEARELAEALLDGLEARGIRREAAEVSAERRAGIL